MAILSNELRIGNWVMDEKNRVVQIHGIESNWNYVWLNHLNGSSVYCFEIERINPIPLTPEILQECANTVTDEGAGFKANYYRFRITDEGDGLYLREYFAGGFLWGLSSSEAEFELGQPKIILYLHQLQNLIHALTGTELTYKP